ncbi:unnamed protein product [Ceratitis capitata]|uniref:(Mediterranean fruit fly) hypothetical protein n=1 Tax=Ceratitis capitata TaxID=7213 RepID=A0A811U2D8_CERCA|nr:unnamed protein product [Ceratitis capitata]
MKFYALPTACHIRNTTLCVRICVFELKLSFQPQVLAVRTKMTHNLTCRHVALSDTRAAGRDKGRALMLGLLGLLLDMTAEFKLEKER